MNGEQDGYYFYRVLRPLDIENIVMSNQVLRTSFEAGDILRSRKSLPPYLTMKKLDGIPFTELLRDEMDHNDYFDFEVPDYLMKLEFKKVESS